ncbi:MAG: hypothetical protein IT503_03805 [Burkholderiaceae bacterium]|nr:hypothetical protein [Burkholderiaceae bacterium]
MKATLSKLLLQAILALALTAAAAALAQPPKGMPSPQEMDAMMKQMQRELDKLPPEQRKLLVGIQGVTVGGHGEFDDQGLARGGVQVGAGVGDKAEIGGVEVNVGAGAAVGIEFDRSGITDVRLDAGVTASAGAGAVDVAVDGRWGWSAGASAQASGGFDASVF